MAETEDLARSAAERLSEDESLRGDELTDDGFSPLLNWAIAAAQAYAPRASGSEEMDKYTDRLRGVVQSAVQTAESGKLDDPAALLDFEVADKEKYLHELKALKLASDPDENANKLAGVLQAALQSQPPSETENGSLPKAADHEPATNGKSEPQAEKADSKPEKVTDAAQEASKDTAHPAGSRPNVVQQGTNWLQQTAPVAADRVKTTGQHLWGRVNGWFNKSKNRVE